MSVYVVADTQAGLSSLCAMLEPKHPVTGDLLGAASIRGNDIAAVIVNADLRVVDNITALKAMSGAFSRIPKRIFVVNERTRLAVVQAYALGATHALLGPVKPAQLLAKLAQGETPSIVPSEPASSAREAASVGAASFASMFSAVTCGWAVNVAEAKDAGNVIAETIAEHGLSDWLATVRRHHEGTYQHCLLVTGIAVDFGLSLRMAKADIERLYAAAMFHDLGKARIPLAVLDKPGKLDAEERALIETHPAAGHAVLKGTPGVSAEILDAVRHHHEFLDGSGYPDGLCAESISDIVRILTISDIFSALIERRTYKQAMSRPAAYEVLQGMKGKLERPLVEAFRDVALNR
ncbi:HD domain-containing protein [Bradyrhizobium sp. Arg237L]|uniref:HD-GYP domain-containing protein n=1 Tax=Bradyrhizobium sp. Arg237L TaxID=3003352 RepID=UPI00249F5FFC|nr:HD domain-containing phosphohydrolase [Bradyrhizobium sp. Arg237L]MDI4236608.1 HD domain-containing protein [Bradyrhizobium sp. Arg237L]